jgi:NAD(P)-dependent dehydrogenase (short-subunit alcohol dehydrogenase family)
VAVSSLESFSLKGKVAIVTGVGPAMGRDFAVALASAGADVCLAARSRVVIDEAASEVEALGRRALALTVDVTDSAQVDDMVRRTVDELGRLDVMCNHAGSGSARYPLTEMPDDEWDSLVRVNLTSVMYGTRAAARAMIEQGEGGSIINTSSISSVGMFPANMMAYATSKAGVNHFTRLAALELAPHDIRVNAIVPGFFEGARVQPEMLKWLEGNTPMPRPSRVDECNGALIYLASAASSYVTGEMIRVSGGGFVLGS